MRLCRKINHQNAPEREVLGVSEANLPRLKYTKYTKNVLRRALRAGLPGFLETTE
jgi:hypothetical protein